MQRAVLSRATIEVADATAEAVYGCGLQTRKTIEERRKHESTDHQENESVPVRETLSRHKAIRPLSASHGNRLRLLRLACF